jgi:Flp pilus assembly protein TadG
LPARDRGSITAEFAAVIPAVLLVLACSLAGMQLAGQQLRLQDAAATTARALARGDTPPAIAATVTTSTNGDILCARLTQDSAGLIPITLGAESCALAGGR